MDETVLTSNLKKMPKKLIKELANDMLALFPKAPEGENPPAQLVAAWLKVYSTIKQTHPAGNIGFNVPIDDNFYFQFRVDAEAWMEGEEAKLTVRKYSDSGDTKIHSTTLTRATLLQLHNFTATAIAHLPNE